MKTKKKERKAADNKLKNAKNTSNKIILNDAVSPPEGQAEATSKVEAPAADSLNMFSDYRLARLIQPLIGWPHKPIEEEAIERRGSVTRLYQIIPGAWENDRSDQGKLPYGSIPRLLMFEIIETMHQSQQRKLMATEILKTLSSIFDPFSTYDQLKRLLNCKLFKEHSNGFTSRRLFSCVTFAERTTNSLIKGFSFDVELFHRHLSVYPDLERDTLIDLSDSPLAMDIYIWLSFHELELPDDKPILHWQGLRQQYAFEYPEAICSDEEFRTVFKTAVKKALAACDTFKVKFDDTKMVFSPYRRRSRAQAVG